MLWVFIGFEGGIFEWNLFWLLMELGFVDIVWDSCCVINFGSE